MKRIYITILIILICIREIIAGSGPVTHIKHSGLRKTSKSTVDYFILNRTGKIFSEELWLIEKNSLMNLDIFSDIEVEAAESDEGTVLTYKYKELPGYLLFPAMKRTDQDGLLMGPGVTFLNLFGKGIHQELLSRFTVAPETMRAKELLSYTRIPDVYGLMFDTEITVNYFKSYNPLKLYNENSVYSQAELTYRLKKYYRIIGAFTSMNVKHDPENSIFSANDVDIEMFDSEGSWDFIPSAGIGFAIDTRERVMNPHSGVYNEFRFAQSGRKLGGDWDYREYTCDFRAYIPVSIKNIIHLNMLSRYRPGTIPAYELYHAGGVNSLRTYDPDPELCGQHEVLATAEYRYELFANRQIEFSGLNGYYGLQIVGGVDNAWEWLPGASFRENIYRNSLYAGVHLIVPVLERVRLEFGINSPDREEKTVRFGINLGWYEKAYTQKRRVR